MGERIGDGGFFCTIAAITNYWGADATEGGWVPGKLRRKPIMGYSARSIQLYIRINRQSKEISYEPTSNDLSTDVVFGELSPVCVSAEVFYSDEEGEVVCHYALRQGHRFDRRTRNYR